MNYREVTNERQFKSATGLGRLEFKKLLIQYTEVHEDIFGKREEESYKDERTAPKLRSIGDTLFFVLFQLKNDLINDSLGLIFKMDGSNANRNFEKYLTILKATLKRNNTYPKRYFTSLKEFEECLKNEEEIIIDGEEQGIERPQDTDNQKDRYSGKKKAHRKKYGDYK